MQDRDFRKCWEGRRNAMDWLYIACSFLLAPVTVPAALFTSTVRYRFTYMMCHEILHVDCFHEDFHMYTWPLVYFMGCVVAVASAVCETVRYVVVGCGDDAPPD